MILYRYTRQKFSLVHSRELKVNYATLGDAVGLPDSKLKCPGYYAVFISKDPVVPQVNYLHRWAWGGGGGGT